MFITCIIMNNFIKIHIMKIITTIIIVKDIN